jgi:hypothetical protein
MRVTATILGALMAISLSTPADAYGYRTCGGKNLRLSGNNLGVYASAVSFPTGYWRDGLQNSINQFNRNPSNFYYSLYTDTNGVARGNGQSEIWGTTDQGVLQGAPAIAYSYWQCYWTPWSGWNVYMTEGDIAFDYTNTAANPFEWTATRLRTILIRYGGTRRLLQGTAVHELGHAVGLLHENRTYNVMGSDFTHIHTNGTVSDAYIGEDAGNATVFLYGLWASGPLDVAAEHWKYLGTSGEYSTHTKTILTNSAGGALSTLNVNGEVGYYVRRGQIIRAQFTFENNGRATVSNLGIRFYVSTNDIISTADRLILSLVGASLARNWVSTWTYSMTIPSNLALNTTYWLGPYVDPTNAVPETDHSNNATYLPIRVIP